jgi:N-acetylmuramoyl-L-alanine amidase
MTIKNLIITTVSAAMTATMLIAPVYATVQHENRLADQAETECLALNIYYEARSSNLADKAAVADVVINRTQDRRYPNTICGVVQDGYKANRRDCQFSWYCDGKSDIPQDQDRWMEAQSIAFSMIAFGDYRGITEGATHYHATYVDPFWASSLQMVGRIGQHIYYRWEN